MRQDHRDDICPTCGRSFENRCQDCRALKTPIEVKLLTVVGTLGGLVLLLAAVLLAIGLA